MRVVQRTFHPGGWRWLSSDIFLCTSRLHRFLNRYFNLPAMERIKALTLSLHSKPLQDRLKLEVHDWGYYSVLCCNGEHLCTKTALDDCLKPYAGKSLYLQVEYVEK